MVNEKKASETPAIQTELQAPAVYYRGKTVFGKNTYGTLRLSGGTFSFITSDNEAVFNLQAADIRIITIASTEIAVRIHGGSKWNYDYVLDISPSSRISAITEGVTTALAVESITHSQVGSTFLGDSVALHEMSTAEKTNNRQTWIDALRASGFKVANRGVKWSRKIAPFGVLGIIILAILIGVIMAKLNK